MKGEIELVLPSGRDHKHITVADYGDREIGERERE
jgi:hypothetical protein